MKKIIIGLVTVACATIVNAASVTWNLSAVQASDGSGAAGGYLAMVFDAATSQSDVVSAILAKDTTTLGTLANDWAQDTVSTSAGFLKSAGNGSYSASDTFSVYVVIFDAGSVAEANNYFISQTKSGTINAAGSNATLAFGTFAANATATGNTWTAVPEPTSGLLMLLGMAGLALRRRRA